MPDFDTLDGVKKAIRIEDVRGAGRARNYAYSYPFNFSVAAGSSQSIAQKITASAAFVVACATGSCYTGSGVLNTDERITVAFSSNDGQYQQNPVPYSTIVGNAQRPFFFLFRPVFAPGANVVMTIANSSGATIAGSIVFTGHHLGI